MTQLPVKISFTFLFLTIIAAAITSCAQQKSKAEKEVPVGAFCACKGSPEELMQYFPVSAKNDSVVVCDTGKVSYQDNGKTTKAIFVEFLKMRTLATDRKIWDCAKDKQLTFKYYNYAITYKSKRLVVLSEKMFYIYNDKLKQLTPRFSPTYSEELYAKNGELLVTTPRMILEPLKLEQAAIAIIHKRFDELLVRKPQDYQSQLADWLLGAALSGDKIAEDRLRKFNKHFTVPPSEQGLLDDNIAILTDYQKGLK